MARARAGVMFLGAMAVGCAAAEPESDGDAVLGEQSSALMSDEGGYDPPEPPPPPPAPKADLVVTGRTFGYCEVNPVQRASGGVPTEGGVVIEVAVKNIGTAAAPESTLGVFRRTNNYNTWNSTAKTASIAPGETRIVTVRLEECAQNPRSRPDWKLYAMTCALVRDFFLRADVDDVVPELDESNNKLTEWSPYGL